MLSITLPAGQHVELYVTDINGDETKIVVYIKECRGQQARIAIDAPRENVSIWRGKVADKIRKQHSELWKEDN
jgi:sRNA-binding carbon storage regulator CsrA